MSEKMNSSCSAGGTLTTLPYKLRRFFSGPGGARARSVPSGYAYEICTENGFISGRLLHALCINI